MSHEKKEMMNRALSAMTINIGKNGVNDNVIEEKPVGTCYKAQEAQLSAL